MNIYSIFVKLIAAVTILAIVSCGRIDSEESALRSNSIAVEFQPFVERFEYFWGSSIEALTINFGSIDVSRFGDDAAGFCQKMNDGRLRIIFDRNIWFERSKNLSDSERDYVHETLVFHELGHCVLDRDHRNSRFRYEYSQEKFVSIASSIMYPIVPIPYYSENRLYYINELFGRDVAKELD